MFRNITIGLLFLSLNVVPLCSMFLTMKKSRSLEINNGPNFYKAKTENQAKYLQCLNDERNSMIFVTGPAGTGKTALACNAAIKDFKEGIYNKIIITRPVVPVEEEIGFLPGSINKKMDPWIRPIFDVFLEFYSKRELDDMINSNVIEISPLGFMRGRTFKNAFIIADEMQNSSPNQMLMLTTRIGEGSKMVVTGDLKQSDKSGQQSGLQDFIMKWTKYEELDATKYNNTDINHGLKWVELGREDVIRAPIVSKILDIYDVDESSKSKIKENEVDIDCALIPKRLEKGGWDIL